MIRFQPPFALALIAAPAGAQPVVVDLDTAAQCSAAFSIVASEQQRGMVAAQSGYPELDKRGREFFVQTGARLMDERGLTREQVQQRLKAEVEKLQSASDPAAFRQKVMVPCLTLLDATLPSQLPSPR